VGYIAFMKYRFYRTTLTGEKLIKPDWHDSVNRVNLKVTLSEEDRAAMMQELAYQIISQSHIVWKELTRARRGYLADRDAFYSYLKQEVLENWIKAGGKRAVFMDVMVQYARQDWLSAGWSAEDFDKQLQAARRG
jgi:hypothetical protein